MGESSLFFEFSELLPTFKCGQRLGPIHADQWRRAHRVIAKWALPNFTQIYEQAHLKISISIAHLPLELEE